MYISAEVSISSDSPCNIIMVKYFVFLQQSGTIVALPEPRVAVLKLSNKRKLTLILFLQQCVVFISTISICTMYMYMYLNVYMKYLFPLTCMYMYMYIDGTSQSDAYLYADTNGLVWNRQRTCWTRESNFVADVSTVRLSPLSSPSPDHLPSHASSASLDSSVSTLRISTPELPQTSCHGARPHSQMSFISDDLQTIPSQEVRLY